MTCPLRLLFLLVLSLVLAACSAARPPGPPPAATAPPRVILDKTIYASKADRKARSLIVVDGQPCAYSILSDLAPSNIDSIRVLKPARATARYGAAGRNGALLIYTKKGRR